MKLVFSEYKKPEEQAKSLKKQIKETLKRHKKNEKLARNMVENPNPKHEESSASSESVVGDMTRTA